MSEIEKEMSQLNQSIYHLQGSQEEVELQKRYTKCLLMQETFLKQRARINFANQGDRNSKFFHATMCWVSVLPKTRLGLSCGKTVKQKFYF